MENMIMFELSLLVAVATLVFPFVQATLSELDSVIGRAAEFHIRKTGENIRPIASHISRGEILIAQGKYADDGQYRDWIHAGRRALLWRRWLVALMILAVIFVAALILKPRVLGNLGGWIAVGLVVLAVGTYVAVLFLAGRFAGRRLDSPS